MSKRYEKIDVFNQNLSLFKYLDSDASISKYQLADLIFPFGCNASQYQATKNALENQLSVIQGPPGTGKTYNSIFYSVGIIEKNRIIFKIKNNNEDILKKFKEYKDKNLIKFITFHQSYGYEDFIEGIRPGLDNESKDLKYIIHSGVFKDICNKAKNDRENNYVLIIDEINRGNISKIFGELISLIEPSKREGEKEELEVTLPYSKEVFTIPKNLYIIGTMNTADRSIALMDTALRRRFKFEEMLPDYDLLKDIFVEDEEVRVNIGAMLKVINERIEYLYDREHTIGHAVFLELKENNNIEKLENIFKKSVIPLLQEYFYEDYQKIQLILGDNEKLDPSIKFILDEKIKVKSVFKGDATDVIDLPEKKYTINKEAFLNIESYKQIL